jgi:hypothetical protein
MAKLIVSAYSALIEGILITLLLVGAGVAYTTIPDHLFSRDLYAVKDLIKVVIGVASVFIAEVLMVGPFLVLDDIRQSVRKLEKTTEKYIYTANSE